MSTRNRRLAPLLAAALVAAGSLSLASLTSLSAHDAPRTAPATGVTTGTGREGWAGPNPSPSPGPDPQHRLPCDGDGHHGPRRH